MWGNIHHLEDTIFERSLEDNPEVLTGSRDE